MDVKFVRPEPGYVIKTTGDGDTQVFINICKSEVLEKPSSERKRHPDGSGGLQWSIPHSFAPAREDVDQHGRRYRVFDVVFHPDTYRLAETNIHFRRMLHDTAMQGIQNTFKIELEMSRYVQSQMKYMGQPKPTIIRNKADITKKTDDRAKTVITTSTVSELQQIRITTDKKTKTLDNMTSREKPDAKSDINLNLNKQATQEKQDEKLHNENVKKSISQKQNEKNEKDIKTKKFNKKVNKSKEDVPKSDDKTKVKSKKQKHDENVNHKTSKEKLCDPKLSNQQNENLVVENAELKTEDVSPAEGKSDRKWSCQEEHVIECGMNDNGVVKKEEREPSNYTTPEYTIVQGKDSLVISVELPRIKSASAVELDIYAERLELTVETPAKYQLNIDLPQKIDENQGRAKFDKGKRRLVITLPVLEDKALPDGLQEICDNGTSDNISSDSSSSDSPDEGMTETLGNDLVEIISNKGTSDDISDKGTSDNGTSDNISSDSGSSDSFDETPSGDKGEIVCSSNNLISCNISSLDEYMPDTPETFGENDNDDDSKLRSNKTPDVSVELKSVEDRNPPDDISDNSISVKGASDQVTSDNISHESSSSDSQDEGVASSPETTDEAKFKTPDEKTSPVLSDDFKYKIPDEKTAPVVSAEGQSDQSSSSSQYDDAELKSFHQYGAVKDNKKSTLVMPEYEVFQDKKFVTFIFLCRKVNKGSVMTSYPSEGKIGCRIKFNSMGTDGFPICFSFVVQFEADNFISPDKTDVDVSRDNVVLLLTKAKNSRRAWDTFQAGSDAECLERSMFVSETSVGCEAEERQNKDSVPSSNPGLHVKDLNRNNVTIEIKANQPLRVSKFSESSSDVEIVYDAEQPRLQGILKQRRRNMSESSEEPLSGSSIGRSEARFSFSRSFSRENSVSESPISEEEERKSVSFSPHVERTSYKQGSTVSALHSTLKNKRKRQKRHEVRAQSKTSRRRRDSSASGSCSDNHSDPDPQNEPCSDLDNRSDPHSDLHNRSDVDVPSVATPDGPVSNLSFLDQQRLEQPLICDAGDAQNMQNDEESNSGVKSKKKKKNRSRKKNKTNKESEEASSDGVQAQETSATSDIEVGNGDGRKPKETSGFVDIKVDSGFESSDSPIVTVNKTSNVSAVSIAGRDGHLPPQTNDIKVESRKVVDIVKHVDANFNKLMEHLNINGFTALLADAVNPDDAADPATVNKTSNVSPVSIAGKDAHQPPETIKASPHIKAELSDSHVDVIKSKNVDDVMASDDVIKGSPELSDVIYNQVDDVMKALYSDPDNVDILMEHLNDLLAGPDDPVDPNDLSDPINPNDLSDPINPNDLSDPCAPADLGDSSDSDDVMDGYTGQVPSGIKSDDEDQDDQDDVRTSDNLYSMNGDDVKCLNGQDQPASDEHKTQCAFKFTNTIMYELD